MDAPLKEVTLPQGVVRYRESGSGEPIVLVHGLLVNGLLWRKVVPLLDGDFRCLVPELPLGSHDVPLNPSADLSPLGLARLIDDFMAELGLEDVTLVGNDMGGALSQIVAADRPGWLARLVLTPCDTYENFPPAMFRYLLAAARVPGAPAVLMQPTRFRVMRHTPITFGWLAKRRIPDEVTDAYLSPVLGNRDIRRDVTKVLRGISNRYTLEAAEKLRSFDRPVLLAWAPEDRFFKLRYAERLARDIPDARLERIEDSYSFVSEDQPERTAELIRSFVREGAGSRA